MYVPASFRVEDLNELYRFIEVFGFATVVTNVDGAFDVSHVPLLLDRERRVLLGHLARPNRHRETLAAGLSTLAIFNGPHAYVSPSWYAIHPAVPTWNYAVVHVTGTPRLLDDDATKSIVRQMVHKYENHRENPWAYDLPADYESKMLAGIVGFELPIERIEGKFKLGQNRSVEDQQGMLSGLREDGPDGSALANFITVRER
jgi:transcriptional regulator